MANLLYLDPASLLLSHKHISELFFFLNSVEVINNNTHEKIDDKLTSHNHECNKVKAEPLVTVHLWFKVNASGVDTTVHHIYPAFSGCHLEKGIHGVDGVVEVGVFYFPFAVGLETISFCIDRVHINDNSFPGLVVTFVKHTFEEVDSHDRENEDKQ